MDWLYIVVCVLTVFYCFMALWGLLIWVATSQRGDFITWAAGKIVDFISKHSGTIV